MASFSDLLFEMTEWLRTTSVLDLALWVDTTEPRNWLQERFYAIPLLQSVHIIAIAITFGSALMMNARVLGVAGAHRSMTEAMDRYGRVIWLGLCVLIISGIGLVISEPIRDLVNPFFWIKMGLLVSIILINAAFNMSVKRKMAAWERSQTGRAGVRIGAIILILLWCAIMACGRLIAYAPV